VLELLRNACSAGAPDPAAAQELFRESLLLKQETKVGGGWGHAFALGGPDLWGA
jgi:hypothetical protein